MFKKQHMQVWRLLHILDLNLLNLLFNRQDLIHLYNTACDLIVDFETKRHKNNVFYLLFIY